MRERESHLSLWPVTIKARLPCMLKQSCRAWQIWYKQHLRRWWNLNEPRNLMHGFFHADEEGGSEGVTPHFLFMRFHGLLLVVPELCVCAAWCVSVCLKAKVLASHQTHTHTHTQIYMQVMFMQGVKRVGGGKQYSMQPTTYNVWSLCFLRQRREKKNVYLMTTVNGALLLWVRLPHSESTCC